MKISQGFMFCQNTIFPKYVKFIQFTESLSDEFAIYKHLPFQLVSATLTFQMIWNLQRKSKGKCKIAKKYKFDELTPV